MTTIVWVPGLQGMKGADKYYTANDKFNKIHLGTNGSAVEATAYDLGCDFLLANYQSPIDPNPLLSEMGMKIARLLTLTRAYRNPLVFVGSSVGVGVVLDALSRLKNGTAPIALIAYKPVPDPLLAIGMQIPKEAMVALNQGHIKYVPMPVESADETIQDKFNLTARHMNDERALRILSGQEFVTRFNASPAAKRIVEGSIIYGKNDRLTPEPLMRQFQDSVHSTQLNLVALDGDHGTDLRDALKVQIQEVVARLG
jgi:hypothetical protein